MVRVPNLVALALAACACAGRSSERRPAGAAGVGAAEVAGAGVGGVTATGGVAASTGGAAGSGGVMALISVAGFGSTGGAAGEGLVGEAGAQSERCGPMPGDAPEPNEPGLSNACPNGTVSTYSVCSPKLALGFAGTIDGETVELVASEQLTPGPGTAHASVRGCGGPLTFVLTLAFAGEREGDTLNVFANATSDCLLQASYISHGDDYHAILTLELHAFGASFSSQGSGPVFLEGTLRASGSPGEPVPLIEGDFSLETALTVCL